MADNVMDAADNAKIESELLYQKAFDFFQQANYQQALPMALELSTIRPDDWRFHFLTAMSLQFLGDCQAASAFYGYTLLLDPGCTPAVLRLAECLEKNGDIEQAKRMYESVIERGRNDPGHYDLQRHAQQQLNTLH